MKAAVCRRAKPNETLNARTDCSASGHWLMNMPENTAAIPDRTSNATPSTEVHCTALYASTAMHMNPAVEKQCPH
eukprot:CAMPEP_0114488796 /NCGR_PEP_ID=MMETSP0109-20121206/1525_1 /TAXON_ID=29199 /ORGANISM="Chlorarachnion reptans, Strain CCCM449" /LENGTH=74 /DNA_ID=CAMNT_0001665221 /DNA_START=364 /DNA_END=588 /DNA_ORIENTATION=-